MSRRVVDRLYNVREKELRNGLLLFESERMTMKIYTVRDIFTHRQILRQSRFRLQTLNHLARLIRDALKVEPASESFVSFAYIKRCP